MLVNQNRIRSIIADCKTEADIVSALRSHKIKYTFTTETGPLNIRIPCRKGYIRIYRTCSRSAPFLVRNVPPIVYCPVPFYPAED